MAKTTEFTDEGAEIAIFRAIHERASKDPSFILQLQEYLTHKRSSSGDIFVELKTVNEVMNDLKDVI
jgi:hypothetical protein